MRAEYGEFFCTPAVFCAKNSNRRYQVLNVNRKFTSFNRKTLDTPAKIYYIIDVKFSTCAL